MIEVAKFNFAGWPNSPAQPLDALESTIVADQRQIQRKLMRSDHLVQCIDAGATLFQIGAQDAVTVGDGVAPRSWRVVTPNKASSVVRGGGGVRLRSARKSSELRAASAKAKECLPVT